MQNNNTPLNPEFRTAVQLAISTLMGVDFCSSHLNLCREIDTDGDALYQLMLDVYAELRIKEPFLSQDARHLFKMIAEITIEEWIQMIMFDMYVCFQSNITLALPSTLPNGEPLSDRTEDIIYTPNQEATNAQ